MEDPHPTGRSPDPSSQSLCSFFWPARGMGILFRHGEVRVYRGTGVSRGVRRTTWERSLKNWELQISCFEEFFGGENVLGLVPASLPHTLGYPCTFYAPTSLPQLVFCCIFGILGFLCSVAGPQDCNSRCPTAPFWM